MTLMIDLSAEAERRLKSEAARAGLSEAEYARRLVEQGLSAVNSPSPVVDQGTLDLLAKWDQEDATQDPAEIARRKAQWEQFRNSMNANSISGRPVYP